MSAEREKIVDDVSVSGPAVGQSLTRVKRKNSLPLPVFAASNFPFFFLHENVEGFRMKTL